MKENQRKNNRRAELVEAIAIRHAIKGVDVSWIEGDDGVCITLSTQPHLWLATIACPDDENKAVKLAWNKTAGTVNNLMEEIKLELKDS